jgi:malate dehydrogenase (oxaloacetate-decarboxylating)(NADP+)
MYDATRQMRERNYFGAMMVETGEADAMISGLTKNYPRVIKPALEIIGVAPNTNIVAGMYVINNGHRTLFFADTTVNVDPSAEDLVTITGLTQKVVQTFGYEPKVAMISYSNFGSSKGAEPDKCRLAVKLAKQKYPNLTIDGEMQADVALRTDLLKENYPFSDLAETGANTLIFPTLSAGNNAYKLLQTLGVTEAIGPILMGMRKPIHVLQLGSSVREIINMVAIAVVEAQAR